MKLCKKSITISQSPRTCIQQCQQTKTQINLIHNDKKEKILTFKKVVPADVWHFYLKIDSKKQKK